MSACPPPSPHSSDQKRALHVTGMVVTATFFACVHRRPRSVSERTIMNECLVVAFDTSTDTISSTEGCYTDSHGAGWSHFIGCSSAT